MAKCQYTERDPLNGNVNPGWTRIWNWIQKRNLSYSFSVETDTKEMKLLSVACGNNFEKIQIKKACGNI